MKINILKKLTAGAFTLVLAAILISCVPVKEKPQPQIPVKKAAVSLIEESNTVQTNWKDAPALKDEYKKYFDYFGFAVPENQLTNDSIMKGISWQASCFT